ncbi:MAG: hypothetical protein KR126chlam6_00595 [Candidatus Anoxychlamydiales bacterium]|nr:hypothetical protein [Candidatus Anoxychlamydiales bacterium]
MQLQTKALYNLVRFTSHYNPSQKVKKWQSENLRDLDDKKLFEKLKKFNLNLDKETFLQYGSQIDSPEELAELIAAELENEDKDQIYLVLFELYRRFLSDKRSLSIFCDELDHQIFLYDTHQLKNDELLQNALDNLKNILDSSFDLGTPQKKAFKHLLQYLAHDLDNFLFDYIHDQIDAQNEVYAFDLVDGFYPYIEKNLWFDFLKAKLLASKDITASNGIIEKIIDENPNLELQLRILYFMVDRGDRNLFLKIAKRTAQHLKKERELKHLLELLQDFYLRLDNDKMEIKISNLLKQRLKIHDEKALKKLDIDELLKILS